MNTQQKIFELQDYYCEHGLLVVGLNDSQGINTNPLTARRNLLTFLAKALKADDLEPEVIDAFSMFLNKTYHIDYMLKCNLSLEEIKLSQLYAAVAALEKIAADFKMPKWVANIAYLYAKTYEVRPNDHQLNIVDLIRAGYEPTVIYSSGPNDLMRLVANNPFKVRKDYQADDQTAYEYTLKQISNPEILSDTIKKIEANVELLLSINPHTDIYILGAYLPESLRDGSMATMRQLIISYNIALKELASRYQITYVDTELIGNSHNNDAHDFHITGDGHHALAELIIHHMFERKIVSNMTPNLGNAGAPQIIGGGSERYKVELQEALNLEKSRIESVENYEREVFKNNIWERETELLIMDRVVRTRTK